MSPIALLHGDPGRLPFVGHFRAQRTIEGANLAASGRVHARGDVSAAFRIARAIEATIRGCPVSDGADRHDLLSAVWQAIHDIEGCDLGPDKGEDLVILFVIGDEQGTGIAGMGLGGVWAIDEQSIRPLVEGDHPLLGGPGRPDRLPGVLTLDEPASTVVCIAHDHPNQPPNTTNWRQACGVNP